MNENDTLPPIEEMEAEEMPEIVCVKCGRGHSLVNQGIPWAGSREPFATIRGTLACHSPADTTRGEPCTGQTLFELTRNAISWAPGKLFQEDLRQTVAPNARTMFNEALLSFYERVP